MLKIGFGAPWPRPHRLVRWTIAASRSIWARSSSVASPLEIRVEQHVQLGGADPAGDALAARLLAAEVHEVLGDVDHAGGVVHDDHAARAHERAHGGERLVVDRHVEELGGDAAARRAAGLDRLERPAVDDPAADVEDDLAQRRAHRDLYQAGVDDPAGEGEDLGALALLGADAGEPVAAVADDRGDVGEGLDVVDERRTAPQTRDGRVRRARAAAAAAALDRRDQRGLLAADERAGAEPHLDLEARTRCRAMPSPEVAGPAGLADRLAQPADHERVLGRGSRRSPRWPRRRRPAIAMPSSTRCGSLSRTLRSMNAPGSPSSALQMTYFLSPPALAGEAPLQAGGVAGAAAAAQAAADVISSRTSAGVISVSARPQRPVAAGRDIVVEALGVDPCPEFSVAIRTWRAKNGAALDLGLDGRRHRRQGVDDRLEASSGPTCLEQLARLGDLDERARRRTGRGSRRA